MFVSYHSYCISPRYTIRWFDESDFEFLPFEVGCGFKSENHASTKNIIAGTFSIKTRVFLFRFLLIAEINDREIPHDTGVWCFVD